MGNDKGWTPLHLAADGGSVEVASALLDAGAPPSARNGSGLTPLHIAALMGRVDVARLLLARGADPVASDGGGKAPAEYAADAEVGALGVGRVGGC